MSRFLRRILGAMLLGVAVYGGFVVYTGLNRIQESLSRFEWSAFALALTLASSPTRRR